MSKVRNYEAIQKLISILIENYHYGVKTGIKELETQFGISHSFIPLAKRLGHITKVDKGMYKVNVKFTNDIIDQVYDSGQTINESDPVKELVIKFINDLKKLGL